MNETINNTVLMAANQTPEVLGYALPLTGFPVLDIYFITLFAALFTTLINKHFSDQIKIKALRKEMKDLQKKMRATMKSDPKKAQKMQQEIFKKNMENMKHAMNPKILLLTMFPLLVLFIFVRTHYGPFGEFLDLGFTEFGWLGSYITFSIINSIVLKKVMDVA